MRLKQTARKSTSVRDPMGARYASFRLDGLGTLNDLDAFEAEIVRMNASRYVNDENQANPVVMMPFVDLVGPRAAPRDAYRVTSGRNGRLVPPPRTRQVARKYTGPDPRRYPNRSPTQQVSSTTESRSKQVRKRPEEEVSPGGTRRADTFASGDPQPSSSTQATDWSGGDAEPGPSTSTRRPTTRQTARRTRNNSEDKVKKERD